MGANFMWMPATSPSLPWIPTYQPALVHLDLVVKRKDLVHNGLYVSLLQKSCFITDTHVYQVGDVFLKNVYMSTNVDTDEISFAKLAG